MPKTTLLPMPRPMSASPIACRGLHPVLQRRLAQHADRDRRAAEDADQVGVEAEERHHEGQREHARQDEEVHRRDAHGDERLDLLVHLHRAELRRRIPSRCVRP